MYDSNRSLADATVHDLWTALLLKRHFNSFEPQQIVQDLYAQRHLWQKCWLGWLMFEVEFYQEFGEAPIARLLEMLVYAQDDQLYKNDVLYIQSAGDDCVPALLDLAKQWQADDCEVFDRIRLALILGKLAPLIEVLGEEKMSQTLERWKAQSICSPIIGMWWD